jgi:hypothetical protein
MYAVHVTPNTTIQDWKKVDYDATNFHLLTYAGGLPQCVDVCLSTECGSDKGNIIWWGCHWGLNQQWFWEGAADANGAMMLKNVFNGKCITACPAASLECNWSAELTSDVSTTACNAADPSQRWVFGSLREFMA